MIESLQIQCLGFYSAHSNQIQQKSATVMRSSLRKCLNDHGDKNIEPFLKYMFNASYTALASNSFSVLTDHLGQTRKYKLVNEMDRYLLMINLSTSSHIAYDVVVFL